MNFTYPLLVSISDLSDSIVIKMNKAYFLRAWTPRKVVEEKCTINCGGLDVNLPISDGETVEEAVEEAIEDDELQFDDDGNPIFDDSDIFGDDDIFGGDDIFADDPPLSRRRRRLFVNAGLIKITDEEGNITYDLNGLVAAVKIEYPVP